MRYFITFSYDGTCYHGWQIQPNGVSVQEVLQNALSTLLRTSIAVVGAGRTDAGVHARMMVAHFDIVEQDSDCYDVCRNQFRVFQQLRLNTFCIGRIVFQGI